MSTDAGATIAERLAAVRSRVGEAAARAGRDPDDVTLVVVSKEVEVARVREVLAAGATDLGENRAQDLVGKARELSPHHRPTWHFVGRLQSNKVKSLAPHVTWWHSIDRTDLVPVLARHAPGARVLVQVNLAREEQKGGCAPAETPRLVDELRSAGLDASGLMTVPPATGDPRPHFAALRELASRLGLEHLSMGMTGDFEIAVEEGATFVRIGTALFGPRRIAPDLRR